MFSGFGQWQGIVADLADFADFIADFIAGIVAGDVADLTPCPLPSKGRGRAASMVAGMVADAKAELLAVFAVGPGLPAGWVGVALGVGDRVVAEHMGAECVIATVLAGVAAKWKEWLSLLPFLGETLGRV